MPKYFALAALVLLAGCSTAPRVGDSFHSELISAYQVDSGDRLRIIVFGQDDELL